MLVKNKTFSLHRNARVPASIVAIFKTRVFTELRLSRFRTLLYMMYNPRQTGGPNGSLPY